MPLPPPNASLRPILLHDSGPQLRIYARPLAPSPRFLAQPSASSSEIEQAGHPADSQSSSTIDEQPTLQRKMSQHLEKGEYYQCGYRCHVLTVIVIGASGDLAKKKTYPSLFALYKSNYLPDYFHIIGYARSKKTDEAFRSSIRPNLLKASDDPAVVESFLAHCLYRSGSSYEDRHAVQLVADEATDLESECMANKLDTLPAEQVKANRLFYFAVPPTVFTPIARVLKQVAVGSHNGWSRFIVEKPFGHDLTSFEKLNSDMSSILQEKEMYRIDHYVGKEAVQNLLVLRFSNVVFEPLWNRQHVSCVVISFKENFGTKGRGGYFDKSGIIRDVMQNHLLQVLTMFAMDTPVRSSGDAIRDEKVKVLRAIQPIRVEDCLTGQYIADDEGREQDYTADEGVPEDSKTPTFASTVLYIDNSRWEGVPFIMRAGKALNERKSEIRMQFKRAPGAGLLFPGVGVGSHGLERNELVMRLQPNEAVYLKMNIKEPGLVGTPTLSELDLSYRDRYPDKFSALPDAYTRLMLQVLRGDSSAFVRDDELREAWRIFTPLLHAVDKGAIEPIKYKAFSRGPKEFDQLTEKLGYVYAGDAYKWGTEESEGENGQAQPKESDGGTAHARL